jgi:hypothetical protein
MDSLCSSFRRLVLSDVEVKPESSISTQLDPGFHRDDRQKAPELYKKRLKAMEGFCEE